MANVQVFAHKGILGINALEIDTTEENGYKVSDALLNDITQPGQLGCVADGSKCDFSQEAIDLIKTVKPSHDCIGDIDIYKDASGNIVFCWLGAPTRLLTLSDDISASRDHDVSILDEVTIVPNNPPEGFIEAVDAMLAEKS